jgi:membrane associated rhomboid family serine protease
VNVPIALLWPARSHGLSGVIYGLLGYLLVIGWLEKKILPIVLSLVAFWLYGSALMALIPGVSPAGVSWVGHAGGFMPLASSPLGPKARTILMRFKFLTPTVHLY